MIHQVVFHGLRIHSGIFTAYRYSTQLRSHLPKTVREVLSAKLAKRSQKPQAVAGASQVVIGTWRARKNVYPQWADYLPIPLEKYSPRSFSLAGNLYSDSPYFRLGFKLFPLEGKEFGDSAIQSRDEANLLVHVGKNADADTLFLTSYYTSRGRELRFFQALKTQSQQGIERGARGGRGLR